MIVKCDICGKYFDTDTEIGDVIDNTTYCEDCLADSFEDEEERECYNNVYAGNANGVFTVGKH